MVLLGNVVIFLVDATAMARGNLEDLICMFLDYWRKQEVQEETHTLTHTQFTHYRVPDVQCTLAYTVHLSLYVRLWARISVVLLTMDAFM